MLPSLPTVYWKILLASLQGELLLKPIYPLLYFLCPSYVFCGGGNASQIKKKEDVLFSLFYQHSEAGGKP